jgi:hypothetical protein
MRDLARLLSAKATVELVEGWPDKAMKTGLDTVTVGIRYADAGGAMIDWLVAQVVIKAGLDSVRAAANSAGIDGGSLRSALSNLPGEDRVRQVVVRNLCVEFHLYRMMLLETKNLGLAGLAGFAPEIETPVSPRLSQKLYTDAVPIFKFNMTCNMAGEYFRQLAFETLGAYLPSPPAGDKLHELVPEASLIQWVRNPIGLILWAMVGPAYHSDGYFVILAHLRATKLFLALRAYHLDHRMLPETLEALVPEYLTKVPVDPLSGQPFIYEPAGSRPVLLSLGADRERDGEKIVEQSERDIEIPLDFAAVPD